MPNLGTVLKSEIARLARKEAKAQVDALRKSSAGYRRDIAALKRQVAEQQRQIAALAKAGGAAAATSGDTGEEGASVRFSAKGLRSMRKRLGLSAAEFGQLAGVSAQSIYNWEAEKTVPRQNQVAALAALRSVGKREAQARLSAGSA